MPSGFIMLPFLEDKSTGVFATLKDRLRKVKGKLLSKVFKRWAVVFFCQHEDCEDSLGAHPQPRSSCGSRRTRFASWRRTCRR